MRIRVSSGIHKQCSFCYLNTYFAIRTRIFSRYSSHDFGHLFEKLSLRHSCYAIPLHTFTTFSKSSSYIILAFHTFATFSKSSSYAILATQFLSTLLPGSRDWLQKESQAPKKKCCQEDLQVQYPHLLQPSNQP